MEDHENGRLHRNKFPLTLYIWPPAKSAGAAAKTDLFFESIPDEFLDFVPEEGLGRKRLHRADHRTQVLLDFGISDLHRPGSNTPPCRTKQLQECPSNYSLATTGKLPWKVDS